MVNDCQGFCAHLEKRGASRYIASEEASVCGVGEFFIGQVIMKTQFLVGNEAKAQALKVSAARLMPTERLRGASGTETFVSAGGLGKICKERVTGKINELAPSEEHKNENPHWGITSNFIHLEPAVNSV